jgi:hypothetical protein
MGDYEILDCSDSLKWQYYLKQLPIDQRDIYYTPEYYKIYEELGDGKATCFVYKYEECIALYPFLLNCVNDIGYNLDKRYYDIQGAYGYNGVITNSNSNLFINKFYNVFTDFCQSNNIIAEFTRFNPVLGNNKFSHYLNPLNTMSNVIVNLTQDNIEKDSYEYSTRKNINKAKKNNLIAYKINPDQFTNDYLSEFLKIYYETMKRNDAHKYYYFPISFFNNITHYLKNNYCFYFVNFKSTIISTELVLYGDEISYSFLGGTLNEFFQYRPNDFLKNFIIQDLKKGGLKFFCLGGGEEGVLKFKKSFAKNGIHPFFIGRKIHNPTVYDNIIGQWETKYPEKIEKHKNLLLRYRY